MPRPNTGRTGGSGGVDISNVISKGAGKIKKKVRDIERLLKRDNIPAPVRVENERALKALKFELENANLNNKAKIIATRYHRVRFFEKKKALRRYTKDKKSLDELEKKMNETSEDEEIKNLKKEIKKQKRVLRHSEIDLLYIVNFPQLEKYISLYASENESKEELNEKAKKGAQKTAERSQEIKKEIAEQLDNGTIKITIADILSGNITREKIRAAGAIDDAEVEVADDQNDEEGDDFFE